VDRSANVTSCAWLLRLKHGRRAGQPEYKTSGCTLDRLQPHRLTDKEASEQGVAVVQPAVFERTKQIIYFATN